MNSLNTLNKWQNSLNKWIQLAILKLIQNDGDLSQNDLIFLKNKCIDEAKGINIEIHEEINWEGYIKPVEGCNLKIQKIKNIVGVNAIKHNASIDFGNNNLCIIYGKNGAGKTGYSRILKKIASPNNPLKILGNVFESNQKSPECIIIAEINNSSTNIHCDLSKNTKSKLNGINIFDGSVANLYIDQSKEIMYEPYILTLLRKLAEVCKTVQTMLYEEKQQLNNVPLLIPINLKDSLAAIFFEKIDGKIDIIRYKRLYAWSDKLESTLKAKNATKMQNPDIEINQIKTKNKSLIDLRKELTKYYNCFSYDTCQSLSNQKKNVKTKLNAVNEIAEILRDNSKIDNIGTELWKNLWLAAKEFSTKEVYPIDSFPKTSSARCVLCHQPIDQETAIRLKTFNDFIISKVNEDYLQEKTILSERLKKIENLPNIKIIDILLKTIDNEIISSKINTFIEKINLIKKDLLNTNKYCVSNKLSDTSLIDLKKNIIHNEEKVKDLEKTKDLDFQNKLNKEILELIGHKWLSENFNAAEQKNDYKKQKILYEKAYRLTNTSTITRCCTELTTQLITQSYINRFTLELDLLGAKHIKIQPVQLGGKSGSIKLKLSLKGSNISNSSLVLSEGEKRVVSLAGFIADIQSGKNMTPIIFDDPISSLDLDYEEKLVKRLITLSQRQQIIVLTHRLPFFANLIQSADNENIPYTCKEISKLNGIAGCLNKMILYGYNPKKRLNTLKNDYLPKAKKLFEIGDYTNYRIQIKSICGLIRECTEFIVEKNLLNDTVSRYRRLIKTLNKVNKLYKIEESDCLLIEQIMTKYSNWEHSQPYESPISLPEITEIKKDIDALLQLIASLKNRMND